jgi:hypothetical protein
MLSKKTDTFASSKLPPSAHGAGEAGWALPITIERHRPAR